MASVIRGSLDFYEYVFINATGSCQKINRLRNQTNASIGNISYSRSKSGHLGLSRGRKPTTLCSNSHCVHIDVHLWSKNHGFSKSFRSQIRDDLVQLRASRSQSAVCHLGKSWIFLLRKYFSIVFCFRERIILR